MCLAKGVQTGDTTCHIFGSLFVVFFCSAINNDEKDQIMTLVIILATILATYFGLYWLISQEIRNHKYEIMNKLKWIEKQNNLLREDVNDLRIQLNDTWKDVKHIKRLEDETRR